MGVKDITEKLFFSFNDVFAEIWNKLVFHEDGYVDPCKLSESGTESVDVGTSSVRHSFRDVTKTYGDKKMGYALLGFENQTKPDSRMILRIMRYDSDAYHSQIDMSDGAASEALAADVFPVFTVVLYFGYTHRWGYPRSLRDLFAPHGKWSDVLVDYRIHVIELAWLSDEERERLSGDARVLADCLYELRTFGRIVGSKQKINHFKALMAVLRAITGNEIFTEVDWSQYSEGECTMCNLMEAYDRELLERGRLGGWKEGLEAGRQEGIEQGIERGIERTAYRMLAAHVSSELILEVTGLSRERLSEIECAVDDREKS